MTVPLPPTEFEFRYGLPKPGGTAELDERGQITVEDAPDSEKTPARERGELPPAILDLHEDTKERLRQWLDQWLTDLESAQASLDDARAEQEKAYRATTPDSL